MSVCPDCGEPTKPTLLPALCAPCATLATRLVGSEQNRLNQLQKGTRKGHLT